MSDAPPGAQQPVRSPRVSRRRIAANFLSIAGTNVLGLGVTILISVYVRRALGPEAIGQLSWAIAVVAYLTVLVSPGLTFVGQRAIAQASDRTEALAALVLTLQTLLASVVYAFVLVVVALQPRGPVVSMLLAIQGVTLFFTAWNMGWVLQAHERMVAPSLAALAFNVLQLPGLMLLVHEPDDLMLYAGLTVAFAFGSVGYNVWYLVRNRILRLSNMRPTLAGCRGVLREAWPLALLQAAVLVIANSSIVVLGLTDGDDAVGRIRLGLSPHAGRGGHHLGAVECLLPRLRPCAGATGGGNAPVA